MPRCSRRISAALIAPTLACTSPTVVAEDGSTDSDATDANTSSSSVEIADTAIDESTSATASSDEASSADTSTAGLVGTCPDGHVMTDYAGKVTIRISIDGTGPYDFIVDTGAPVTVIDPSVLEVVGQGALSIDVAGETLPAPSVQSYPVSSSFPGVSGILGMDVLGHRVIHFDYPRGRFWLAEEIVEGDLQACTHLEGDPSTVPLSPYAGYLFTTGRVEARDGWFLLDTGASLGAITESTWAALRREAPRPAMQGFYTQAIIGTFWADLTALGSITVGEREVASVFSRTIPDDELPHPDDDALPLLGLLPSGYLHHFLLVVDIDGGAMRLDRAAADDAREPPYFFPFGLATETSTVPPLRVGQVLAGSAAADAGVGLGDEIVAVGGQSFAAIPAGSRAWALGSFAEGDAIAVTRRRELRRRPRRTRSAAAAVARADTAHASRSGPIALRSGQPHSAIARSSSWARRSSTATTPADPPSARPTASAGRRAAPAYRGRAP